MQENSAVFIYTSEAIQLRIQPPEGSDEKMNIRIWIGISIDVTARALATYLIPGCAGRGVSLGTESSAGGDAGGGVGVWKSGDLEIWIFLEIWEFGDLGTWKSRNLEICGPGNPEMWGSEKKKNYQNSNPFCPKYRQGLD